MKAGVKRAEGRGTGAEVMEIIQNRMALAAKYERDAREFRQRMQDEAIIRAAEFAGLLKPEGEQ